MDTFKRIAERSYTPWSAPRTDRAKLRRCKRSAQNPKSLRKMKRIESRKAHARSRVIRHYRLWTPYDGPGRTRWAIPFYGVNCESGGSDGVSYSFTIQSPFSGGGAYGILQSIWDQYSRFPYLTPPSWPHLEQHRVAYEVLRSQGSGAWACL